MITIFALSGSKADYILQILFDKVFAGSKIRKIFHFKKIRITKHSTKNPFF